MKYQIYVVRQFVYVHGTVINPSTILIIVGYTNITLKINLEDPVRKIFIKKKIKQAGKTISVTGDFTFLFFV